MCGFAARAHSLYVPLWKSDCRVACSVMRRISCGSRSLGAPPQGVGEQGWYAAEGPNVLAKRLQLPEAGILGSRSRRKISIFGDSPPQSVVAVSRETWLGSCLGQGNTSVFRLVRGRREMAEFCKLNSSRPHVVWCMTFWFPQLWLTMWITLGKARNECWARNLAT